MLLSIQSLKKILRLINTVFFKYIRNQFQVIFAEMFYKLAVTTFNNIPTRKPETELLGQQPATLIKKYSVRHISVEILGNFSEEVFFRESMGDYFFNCVSKLLNSQRRIQNPARHLRWSVSRQQLQFLTAFNDSTLNV